MFDALRSQAETGSPNATMRLYGLTLILVLALGACASSAGGQRSADRDRSILTNEQLNERAYNHLYQAIETLRPRWLRRPPTADVWPAHVTVILNNSRLGGLEALQSLTTHDVTYVRFYEAAEAAARFGRDIGHGVIFVSTER